MATLLWLARVGCVWTNELNQTWIIFIVHKVIL